MKTTELFVEQVLIGIAVVFTAALYADHGLLEKLYRADFGEVALVAAAAYLVGMIYDRVSDSLLQDVDQHHRLLYALRGYYLVPGGGHEDPFPENTLRARLWFSTEAAADYATYLRSRIRLTRALTTLIPALGVGAVLLVAHPETAHRLRLWLPLFVALGYVRVFASKMRRRDPLPAKGEVANPTGDFELPKTWDLPDSRIRAWYEESIGGYDCRRGRPTAGLLQLLLRGDPSISVALLLPLVAGVACAGAADRRAVVLTVAAATPLATALCGWTWWRVTQTFYEFLCDHDINAPRGNTPGP